MSVFEHISKAESRAIISAIMIMAMVVLIGMIFTIEIPAGNREMAYLVVGGFGGSFGTVIAFWFSSSKGSVDKTEIIKGRPNQP